MKASENRAGNWVMGNAPYQLDLNAMSLNATYLKMGKEPYYTPIPLTEEWLLKFGFEEDDSLIDPPDTPNGNFWSDWVKESVIISMPFFEFSYNELQDKIEIKYVHQLQNLYHALTGQELTIKEYERTNS